MWLCERGHFSDRNQAPDCRQIICCLRRWRAGNAAILRVNWHLQRIVVSAHLLLDACDVFRTHGNTHLPRRAIGPLWRPPSGHFFPSLCSIYPSRLGLIRVAAPFWIPSKIRHSPRALLVARALRCTCSLNFPRSWGTPDALAST